jgi:hypothetical protein
MSPRDSEETAHLAAITARTNAQTRFWTALAEALFAIAKLTTDEYAKRTTEKEKRNQFR